MLHDRINDLKSELIEYAALVERMIDNSIRGLIERKKALLVETIEGDEPEANRIEVALDEHGTTMIAQFEPKAKDLRTVLMILRMNNDLERVADHAVNIAESALYLIERPQVKPLIDIPRMAEVSKEMLRGSIDSFIREDVDLAEEVCGRDDDVDGLQERIMKELIELMGRDPAKIERSFHLIRISKNLERIADLSTNIGEDVVFMSKGRVIKHHRELD
jgi:phosphate transport system protein